MRELDDFVEAHREWITEKLWRCSACGLSSGSQTGPCLECNGTEGKLQMKNLYEVCRHLIKPICEKEKVSYVEYLAQRRCQEDGESQGVAVNTFVSHWWGEEFANFHAALSRYSENRCEAKISNPTTWIFVVTWVVASVILAGMWCIVCPPPTVSCSPSGSPQSIQILWHSWKEDYKRLSAMSIISDMVAFALASFAYWSSRRILQRSRVKEWSFWICAFANNQFAIDHAIGINDNLSTSSFATALEADTLMEVAAIVDDDVVVYRRIWCAFELFYARVVLPNKKDISPRVVLINKGGIISDGDAPRTTVRKLEEAMRSVKTAEAKSSSESDKRAIMETMKREESTPEMLDELLVLISQGGVGAVTLRRRGLELMFLFSLSTLLFTLGVTEFVLFRGSLHFNAGWSFLPVSILMVGLLHCATQRMLTKFGKCAQRTPVFYVLRKRGIQVAVLVNSPILIAVMCSLPSEAIGKHMYLMCVHSQLIVIVVGMFFGMLYIIVRERCSRLRQNVEAILFSTKSLPCGNGRH